jgi:hypothetical protein
MRSAWGLEQQFEGGSGSLTLRRKLEKQDIRIQRSGTEGGRYSAAFFGISAADPSDFAMCLLLVNTVHVSILFFPGASRPFPDLQVKFSLKEPFVFHSIYMASTL